MSDSGGEKKIVPKRLAMKDLEVVVDGKGQIVTKLDRNEMAVDAWDVNMGERTDEIEDAAFERKLTNFYKDMLREVKEHAMVVRFYRKHEVELRGYSFGHMVIGLAIAEENAREQIHEDIRKLNRLLGRLIGHVVDMRKESTMSSDKMDVKMEELRDLVRLIRETTNAEDDTSQSPLEDDVEELERLRASRSRLAFEEVLEKMSAWATARKSFLGKEGSSSVFYHHWKEAFSPSHSLENFLKIAKGFEKEEDDFNSVAGRCHAYVVEMFDDNTFVYDHHFTKSKKGDDVAWRRAEAKNLGFYFDFDSAAGLRELFLVQLGNPALNDDTAYKHLVKIIGRLENRYDMVELLKRVVLDEANVDVPPRMEKRELVDAIVTDACTTFDFFLEKNLLDLGLLGLNRLDIERIAKMVIDSAVANFNEAAKGLNEEGSFDDSQSSISISDDPDPGSDSNFDEVFEEDDSIVNHSDQEEEEEPSYYKEELKRKQKMRSEVAKRRRQRAEKKAKGGEDEEEEEDEVDKFEYALDVNMARHREPPWTIFFLFLEREGVDISDFFLEHQDESELPKSIVKSFSSTAWHFVREHAELISGRPGMAPEDALDRIKKVINSGQHTIQIEHAKSDCMAWAKTNPNISAVMAEYIGEAWALVYAFELGKGAKWTPDECRYIPGFHVYRVLHLEFRNGLFGYKYCNGAKIADNEEAWEELVSNFEEDGYPIFEHGEGEWTKDRQKAYKEEYLADQEKLDGVAARIRSRPGLTLAEQFWYLLPDDVKTWFSLAAQYMDAVLLGRRANRAWWHTRNQTDRGPTPWLRVNEIYEMFIDVVLNPEEPGDPMDVQTHSSEMYSHFFSTNTMVMLEAMQYIKSCPAEWKRQFALLSNKYCHYDDEGLEKKADFIFENLVKRFGTEKDWNGFTALVLRRMEDFDCPVKVVDARIHWNDEKSRGHNNAVEIQGVSNFLLVVAHVLAGARLANIFPQDTDVWRSVRGEEESSSASSSDDEHIQGMKRLREFDDGDKKEGKKARFKMRGRVHPFR